MQVCKLWGFPVLVSLGVRGVLLVGVVKRGWALIFEALSVDHLMVNNFKEYHDVGDEGY
jgi:hypothetical protein